MASIVAEARVIATRRGLYVLAAIAMVLAIVLVIDVRRTRGPVDHALLPGFDEATVTSLQWTGHPMGPYLGISRKDPKDAWRRTVPTPGEVEQRAAAEVLATLRGARWHRVKDTVEHGPIMLDIGRSGGRRTSFEITLAPEGTQQAWVTLDGRSYLVDAWVVRALAPDPVDFAVRRPLIAVADAPELRIGSIVIAGDPRRLVPGSAVGTMPVGVVLDPSFVDELEKTVANLEIVALARATNVDAPDGLRITAAGTEAILGGPCNDDPTLVLMRAPSGGGCVRATDAAALSVLVERLQGGPLAIAARQLVPFAPVRITLPGGEVLDLAKRPRIGDKDADDTPVGELLAALSLPAAGVREMTADDRLDDAAAGPRMVVEGKTSKLVILIDPTRRTVKRSGDPVILELAEGAFATLMRPASAYAAKSLWNEDPLTITRLTVSGQAFARGAVVGEWRNANMPDAVDALANLLANPKVLDWTTRPAAPGRRDKVLITITEPTGRTRVHELATLTTSDACVAEAVPNAEGTPPGKRVVALLDPAICDAVDRAR